VGDVLVAVRARRTGEIVGCARTTRLVRVLDRAEAAAELAFDRIPAQLHDSVRISTSLCLDPKFSRGAAAWALLERIVDEAYRSDGRLLLMACDPSELEFYFQAGFRALGPARGTPTGGFRVPLVFVLHDRVHLADIRSPLRGLLRTQPHPLPVEGLRWWLRHGKAYGEEDLALEWVQPGTPLPLGLVDGVSAAGRRALLAGAYRARCEHGQVVVAQGGPTLLGVVETGAIRVFVDGADVGSLASGKIFGQLGLLRGGASPVGLIADAEATVLCIPPRVLNGGLSAADREALWRNLSLLTSDRTAALHRDRRQAAQGDQGAHGTPVSGAWRVTDSR
jgi:hypothetical protein